MRVVWAYVLLGSYSFGVMVLSVGVFMDERWLGKRKVGFGETWKWWRRVGWGIYYFRVVVGFFMIAEMSENDASDFGWRLPGEGVRNNVS